MSKDFRMRNKIAGAIYGFAIGDAMGATTEFMWKEQIEKQYGQVKDIIGGGWLNLKPGEVTDDTQMTMCVMDALMDHPDNPAWFKHQCMRNFVKWFKSGPKDVGGQCAKGITCYMYKGKFISEDENALGNGSLMRAMPCALLNNEKFNDIQGRLTHNNSGCSQILKIYSKLIQNILNDDLYTYETKSLLEPSGYVVNTFNNALYWSNQPTFEEAIIGAVNHGGDADTIAAITGSLAGAKFGYDNIPKKWINQLDPNTKVFLEKFKNFAFSYLQI